MTGMGDVLSAAVEVQRLCRSNSWQFCSIGGVAVQRWGNPRFTADVDLTLLTGYGSETAFVDQLLSELEPRRPDARQFALQYRVLLETPEAMHKLDRIAREISRQLSSKP